MEKKNVKILAIDDTRDNLVVLKALIKDAFPDAIYLSADSGTRGLEICYAEMPDVILLDIVMPGLDGFEVCSKIKSDIRLKHIPVVMVTATRSDKHSRVKALESGADAFLPKPVDESELKAQIRAMIRIKESEDFKIEEKQSLENMVLDRTKALEIELADRIKAEQKLILSLDKITRNRQAIMNLMEDLRTEMAERKIVEENIREKNNELQLLSKLATDLSAFETVENIPVFMINRLKEYTGSEFLVYSEFDAEKKLFITRHIDAEKLVLSKLMKVAGDKILNKPTPLNISDESFNEMITEVVSLKKSLNDASFGAIPNIIDSAFSSFTGIDRYIGLSYVVSGKIYGTTLFGLKKNQSNPSMDLLKSFAHIIAVSLQRRKAEDTLKISEEKFRVLIQNQGEGVGVVDLDEIFVFANPAAEEMFGVKPGQLLNRNLLDFIPEEQRTIIKKESKNRAKELKSTYEVEIVRPDGEKRTVLITATPQFTKDGKIAGTFGVFRDITERKKLELKIIESEAYFRTLIDISPDGILTITPEGIITYGSIKALEIFGIPPDVNVIGSSVLNWVSPEFKRVVLDRISDIIGGFNIHQNKEYKLFKYDNTVFWGELSSSALKDKNGNTIGLLVVCRDISDRKKAEQDLIMARDRAEESDRLKTAFLHNISHEIRTPMNAIVGFASLLADPDLDPEPRRSYTEVITQSSDHLLSIISDIVDISNIEANLVKTSKNEICINTTLKSLYDQFRPKAEGKKISISLKPGLSDSEALILIDSTKLIQIISNLISNAIKFTENGEIRIGYNLKKDFLEFSVTDTGIGIPKEYHARIFDRFYQVHNSDTRLYEGTGLGLAISRAYVDLLGGMMWLSSEPGKGSSFFFTIPYETSKVDNKEEVEINSTSTFAFSSKKTILIAEDVDSNFKLISFFLSKANIRIIRAVNGREAVEKALSGEKIDLILMDIKMPVMDGYTATRIIREHDPFIPIIAQTAYSEDRNKSIEYGCSGFISKPFDKKSLLKILNEFL